MRCSSATSSRPLIILFEGLILMSNILNVAFAYGGLRAKGKRPEKVPIHAAGRISIWYVNQWLLFTAHHG